MNKSPLKSNNLNLLIFSVFLSSSCISQAQTFNYGIKGGLNIAETSFTYGYESQSKTGFNIYIFGDYNVSRNFAVSTMAGYTQKGFQVKLNDFYSFGEQYNGTLNANLNYIDITVSAKVKFTNTKAVPYITLGPSFGINVYNGVNGTGNDIVLRANDLQSLLDVVSKNSIGLKTGAGIEYNINSSVGILFEANYNFDLISIYDAPDFQLGIESWIYSDNVKNNVLEIMTGVKF